MLAGLPGVGKTTLARRISAELPAFWLRIDTIEQTLRDQGVKIWSHGYDIAYAVAADNLAAGRCIVADCVNPLKITRDAWRDLAIRTKVRLFDVEIICADEAAHRRRVETRDADIPNHKLPDWAAVMAHEYEPWDRPRLVVDTAGRDAGDIVRDLLTRLTAP